MFRNPFSSTTIGDENPIRTLEDYSKPSQEGYRNTIELPIGNNVVPLRSDTIRLVQNGNSFHGLRSEDPNQHLKDFLKLVDSLDLDVENRERTRLRLFQFSLRDQDSNWLERLPAGSITTWEDLTSRFVAQFFPPGRTVKLRNDILMSQQHHGESLSEAWTCFKDLLRKVPHHGIDLWLQVQIFYDQVDYTTQMAIDYAAGGRLRKLRPEEAWETIERLAQYEDEGWNDDFVPDKVNLNYKNPDIEQLLGVMERKIDTLMKDTISLIGRSEIIFWMTTNEMYQPPSEPSRQEEFEHIVMNFILDQEESVKQLEEYMKVITGDFMQLSSKVTRRLRDKISEEGSRMRKIMKITKYPDTKVPKPLAGHKFFENHAKKTSYDTLKSIPTNPLWIRHVQLNLLISTFLGNRRIHKDGDGDALFQLKSDLLPHADAQITKTYYKHRDSRIMKAQELKTKTSHKL
ncbi:zinc finger, CCHC-type containing protein [Tanacetum coccineum]|uniref:Zinc finger, CCHC-type containing protein n=1 Tax=Tanacetum coccineum TaxID=301880 RepID=A0ABQ5D906_9ASTR